MRVEVVDNYNMRNHYITKSLSGLMMIMLVMLICMSEDMKQIISIAQELSKGLADVLVISYVLILTILFILCCVLWSYGSNSYELHKIHDKWDGMIYACEEDNWYSLCVGRTYIEFKVEVFNTDEVDKPTLIINQSTTLLKIPTGFEYMK